MCKHIPVLQATLESTQPVPDPPWLVTRPLSLFSSRTVPSRTLKHKDRLHSTATIHRMCLVLEKHECLSALSLPCRMQYPGGMPLLMFVNVMHQVIMKSLVYHSKLSKLSKLNAHPAKSMSTSRQGRTGSELQYLEPMTVLSRWHPSCWVWELAPQTRRPCCCLASQPLWQVRLKTHIQPSDLKLAFQASPPLLPATGEPSTDDTA